MAEHVRGIFLIRIYKRASPRVQSRPLPLNITNSGLSELLLNGSSSQLEGVCLQPMPGNLMLCLGLPGAWGTSYWITGVQPRSRRWGHRQTLPEGRDGVSSAMENFPDGAFSLHQAPVQWVQPLIQPNPQPV